MISMPGDGWFDCDDRGTGVLSGLYGGRFTVWFSPGASVQVGSRGLFPGWGKAAKTNDCVEHGNVALKERSLSGMIKGKTSQIYESNRY